MLNHPSHQPPSLRMRAVLPALALTLVATGCATTTAVRHDPLEPVNRKVFAFNEAVDNKVLKPVATSYKEHVPSVVQSGVSNFFSNLRTPWSAVNLMLQGRLGDSVTAAARFGANTTVGVLGLVDVAGRWGMPHRSEDFGLTLDTWGVGTGPYVVLPIFGPSSVRDALSMPVDSVGNPLGKIDDAGVSATLTATQIVSKRAEFLALGKLLDQAALDKYTIVRDAHLKRRNRTGAQAGAATAGMGESNDGQIVEH